MNKYALIVEDDADTRLLLSIHLKRMGFDCIEAGDALTARDKFLKHSPAVMTLDISLGGSSGFDLINAIVDSPAYKKCSTYILTAFDLEPEEQSYLRANTRSQFTKGYGVDELVKKIALDQSTISY